MRGNVEKWINRALVAKKYEKFAKHNLFIVSLQCLSDNNQCITSHLPFIRVYISFASLTSPIPEHSKGCILMTPKGVEIIKELLTKNEKKDEKTFISIDSRY